MGGESAMAGNTSSNSGIAHVEGGEPEPDFPVIVAEECERLLGQLDSELREIALRKLADTKNKEIAEQLGCSVATVERRLHLIRKTWQSELKS